MSDPRLMKLARTEPRRNYNAYDFICWAISIIPDAAPAGHGHFTPNEVADAIISHACHEFGLLAPVVLGQWGIHDVSDIGDMVMRLIEAEILLGTPDDCLESFTMDMAESLRRNLEKHA